MQLFYYVIVFLEDAYVQQMVRHAYIPNVQQYQMPAASAQFSPQFISQQPQYFNQPMQAQPNQPIQTDSSRIQAQFAAQVAARVGGEKGKQSNEKKPEDYYKNKERTGKIVVRDPKDNKDVTEEILHSGSTGTNSNWFSQVESFLTNLTFSDVISNTNVRNIF